MLKILRRLIFAVAAMVMFVQSAGLCQQKTTDENTKALYLFAHQDDEIPIIAKMASSERAGRGVYVIWITDGSGTADPKLREAESRNTMKFIGVPQENLFFLGYQDRYSWKNLDAVLGDVLKLVEKIQPEEITADAYEGGNIDHDVASLMGTLAAARVPSVREHYEFPLYNSYKNNYRVNQFLPRDDSPTLYTKLDGDLLALKIKALDFYPTQAAITTTMKTLIRKDKLKKYGEPYRAVPKYDYTSRPVEETLGYELNKRNPTSFSDWHDAVVPFLEKLEAAEKK
jgi:LmbE family N-acetylglucosaminyl deacetylase